MSLEGSYKRLSAANLNRVEKYVKLIETLMGKATGRFISLSSPLDYDKSAGELFDFSDYPELSKEIKGIVSKLARGMFTTINTGTSKEWANGTDDANGIIDYVLKSLGYKSTSDLDSNVLGKHLNNHDAALHAFQQRAIGGMDLSTKVWNLANRCKMESELARSIAEGTSASEIASSMKEYLNEPANLFRRVRDEFGDLQLSRSAKAYEPGAGVYRSSYKNAFRLARTEINMAYRNAEQESYKDKDYVVGIEIHRSQIDYDCDVCGQLAGKYPKNFKWSGWHPNCRCYMTPILLTDEEMDARTDAIINGDDFDSTSSKNYVGEMPDNFDKWISNNIARIDSGLRSGSLPYFIRDNFTYVSKILPEEYLSVMSADANLFRLPKELRKEIKSIQNEMVFTDYADEPGKDILAYLSTLEPGKISDGQLLTLIKTIDNELFGGKVAGVGIKDDPIAYMGTGRWQRYITISSHTFIENGIQFNPLEELKNAISSILLKKPLSFNEEYSIESLYHEYKHATAKGWSKMYSLLQEPPNHQLLSMEVANQFCARREYHVLLEKMGVRALHQEEIIKNGYGYINGLRSLSEGLKIIGCDASELYELLSQIIQDDIYENVYSYMCQFFSGYMDKREAQMLVNDIISQCSMN